MSIIAVGGIPYRRSLVRVMKLCASAINGPFEALNFAPYSNGKKICYLRLAPELDPIEVMKRINLIRSPTFAPYAFIPKNIPEFKLAKKLLSFPSEPGTGTKKHIMSTNQVIAYTHSGILREMQTKYPGLYRLNNETTGRGHPTLIYTIALEVYNRLIKIDMPKTAIPTVLQLSRKYRKLHPHTGDFPLIMSTLNQLLDWKDKDHIELKESDLTTDSINPNLNKVMSTKNKYLEAITNKVLEHVNNLPSKMDLDNEDVNVDARTRVREQVRKMTPYLSSMIQEVASKSLIPKELCDISIYCEPSLPARAALRAWLWRRGGHVAQAPRRDADACLFNLLRARAPLPLLACDGAVLDGSKLVIRRSSIEVCDVSIAELSGNKDLDLFNRT